MDKIDTFGNGYRHIRHYVSQEIGGVVITLCNRKIRIYHNADNVSEFYTDGTRFTTMCKLCNERVKSLQ